MDESLKADTLVQRLEQPDRQVKVPVELGINVSRYERYEREGVQRRAKARPESTGRSGRPLPTGKSVARSAGLHYVDDRRPGISRVRHRQGHAVSVAGRPARSVTGKR